MLSRAVVVAVLFALAACARAPAPAPHPQLAAHLDETGQAVVLRVANLRAAQRVGDIRLAGPDGREVPPAERRSLRGVTASDARPAVGVTATGGSESGINPGLSLSLPLFGWVFGGGGPREEYRHGVVARFPLPDGYRADPGAWHLEVAITDATGRTETRRIPAPE